MSHPKSLDTDSEHDLFDRNDLHVGPKTFADQLDSFFKISERGSTIGTEIRAGAVTFITMAYILIVNPMVLSASGSKETGGDFEFEAISTATGISSAIASLSIGIFGNLPFGLAPGMGLNSYFTYGVCLRMGMTWQVALSTVFFQGILFLLLSFTGACTLIQKYAPSCIKKSITVGLGLFQGLIAFDVIELVVQGKGVLVEMGPLTAPLILSLSGVFLIAILLSLHVKAAMLLGIVLVTVVAWGTGMSPAPTGIVQWPHLGETFCKVDFRGYFDDFGRAFPITLVFLFVSIFDTAGVQYAAGAQAKLLEGDQLPNSKAAFGSAAFATTCGALLGTSPVIIHNETCAGIQDGGRTGLTAVTVAIFFIITLPFAPVLKAIPAIATAPPLILVGVFMMEHARFIDWDNVESAAPSFMTLALIPMTYSIAVGMVFGIVTYAVIWFFSFLGRWILNVPQPPVKPLTAAEPMPISPYISQPDADIHRAARDRRFSYGSRFPPPVLGGNNNANSHVQTRGGIEYGAVPTTDSSDL
eukprot:TRINITY_DN261_c0_g2_i1.p1 TRINITY_DN261_c0_g2~~TRINITY_DN261_c0_g2_i1.p1  ORF type:complete len:528 (-),score=117.00 TRINITY_DN261_c0_g2_i1:300-1883(-)